MTFRTTGLARATVSLVLLGISGSLTAHANPPTHISVLRVGIPHQGLMAVAFEKTVGIAVGLGGDIECTEDNGVVWKRADAHTKLALLGVDLRGELSIAVGQGGTIVVRDGSKEWRAVNSQTTERLFSVSLNSKGQAVAVGSFGTVLASVYRGKSCKSIAPS